MASMMDRRRKGTVVVGTVLAGSTLLGTAAGSTNTTNAVGMGCIFVAALFPSVYCLFRMVAKTILFAGIRHKQDEYSVEGLYGSRWCKEKGGFSNNTSFFKEELLRKDGSKIDMFIYAPGAKKRFDDQFWKNHEKDVSGMKKKEKKAREDINKFVGKEINNLEGKTVILSFSGNGGTGYNMLPGSSMPWRRYQEETDKYAVVSMTPKYFFSDDNLVTKVFNISDKTICEDAVRVYKYLVETVGVKDIILEGFSLGGGVASYVAKEAEKLEGGSKVKAVLLHSPIDGVASSVKNATEAGTNSGFLGGMVGKIAGFVLPSYDSLDTFENLKKLNNKKIPIVISSGGRKKDFLSLERTNLDARLANIGFRNVTSYIFEEQGHKPVKKVTAESAFTEGDGVTIANKHEAGKRYTLNRGGLGENKSIIEFNDEENGKFDLEKTESLTKISQKPDSKESTENLTKVSKKPDSNEKEEYIDPTELIEFENSRDMMMF